MKDIQMMRTDYFMWVRQEQKITCILFVQRIFISLTEYEERYI